MLGECVPAQEASRVVGGADNSETSNQLGKSVNVDSYRTS